MVSVKILAAGLALAVVSAIALSLQLQWVYSTFFIFLAALFFAYAGGAPEPGSTLWVRHEGIQEQLDKGKHVSNDKNRSHAGHGEAIHPHPPR